MTLKYLRMLRATDS